MATNTEAIEITKLREDFFSIMEEVCLPDMDDAAMEEYQQRHASDDECQRQEAA